LTDNSLQSANKDQQEMGAVAEKPHDAIVKFGPPCDSTDLVTLRELFLSRITFYCNFQV